MDTFHVASAALELRFQVRRAAPRPGNRVPSKSNVHGDAALAGFGRREGLALAIWVIGWTVQRMEPIKTIRTREWIAAAIAVGQQAAAAGREQLAR